MPTRPPIRLVAALFLLVAIPLTSCGNGDEPTLFGERNPELARQYIQSEPYTQLVLEVDYVTGMRPTEKVIDELVLGLEPLLDKPDGIEVVLDEELSPRGTDHAWTTEELAELAETKFDLSVGENTIKMHILFLDGLDGRDGEAPGILGLSWANRNVVLYKQRLDEVCESGAGDELRRQGLAERACQETELTIWTHEIGHVLGLVNFGIPMVENHEDPEHEYHDHDEDCVMYWGFNRQDAFEEIGKRVLEDDEVSLGFDAACKADIAAVRDNP